MVVWADNVSDTNDAKVTNCVTWNVTIEQFQADIKLRSAESNQIAQLHPAVRQWVLFDAERERWTPYLTNNIN